MIQPRSQSSCSGCTSRSDAGDTPSANTLHCRPRSEESAADTTMDGPSIRIIVVHPRTKNTSQELVALKSRSRTGLSGSQRRCPRTDHPVVVRPLRSTGCTSRAIAPSSPSTVATSISASMEVRRRRRSTTDWSACGSRTVGGCRRLTIDEVIVAFACLVRLALSAPVRDRWHGSSRPCLEAQLR